MTKIYLTPIEDAIRHLRELREENERLRRIGAEKDDIIMAQANDNAELRSELAKVREANAQQAKTIDDQWRRANDGDCGVSHD